MQYKKYHLNIYSTEIYFPVPNSYSILRKELWHGRALYKISKRFDDGEYVMGNEVSGDWSL